MKKDRAPDLTDERIEAIVEIFDTWKGKLTWDLFLDAVEKETGVRYSRFTMAEHAKIADAFTLKKDSLRGTLPRPRGEPNDPRVRAAVAQAERLKAQVERLKAENALLTEQFVVWALNAATLNISMDRLNAPLPKPNRDGTKEKP